MMTKRLMVPSDHPDEHWQPSSLAQTSNKNKPVGPIRSGERNGIRCNIIDVEFWPANRSENIDFKRAGVLIVTGLGQMVCGILQMTLGGAIGLGQDICNIVTRRRAGARPGSLQTPRRQRWS